MEWLKSLLGFKEIFTKALDNLPNSPEKMELMNKFKELENSSLANARETGAEIETNPNASWLSKNIRNILALLVVGSLILSVLVQAFTDFQVSDMLLGGLIGASGSVLTYYFDGTFGNKK